jgi:hypothetical protein
MYGGKWQKNEKKTKNKARLQKIALEEKNAGKQNLKNIFIKTKQILESHRGPLHFGLGMWLGM